MGHTIANVSGSTNVVSLTSNTLFSSSYVGPGAGRYPTANSVVNDIVRLARGMTPPAFTFNRSMDIATDYFSKFYIRINIRDQVGVIKSVGEIAKQNFCLKDPVFFGCL